MIASLNEVEAMARKATRGARYSWGMAEEAAKATRWLCAHGVDGCSSLGQLLTITDGADKNDLTPATSNGVWKAPSGQLCPLMAGAALSDFAFLLAQGEISMENVTCPTLILPFAATAARRQETNLTLELDGVRVVTDGRDVCLAQTGGAPLPDRAALVRVYCGGSLQQVAARNSRAVPDRAIWDQLNRYAARTYAPSSEESRLLGAGAGLSDND